MSILDWKTAPGNPSFDADLSGGFSTTVDGVNVNFAVSPSSSNASFNAYKVDNATYTDGNDPFSNLGGLDLRAISSGDIATNTLTFDQNVQNLNFRISDIDTSSIWNDKITVYGINENGDRVPITTSGGSSVSVTNTDNKVTATGTAPGGTVSEGSASASLEFSIVGPIRQLVIEYADGTGTTGGYQYVVVSDVYFEVAPICFAAGSLIESAEGEVPVEDLRPGDLVQTRDNGLKPVLWTACRHLPHEQLLAARHLWPIRIRAGALGAGVPRQDLLVSPQHRVLVRSKVAERMFGSAEVLVAAKQLTLVEGIDAVCPEEGVIYVHFLLDQHEIVIANGAESETLYTGPQALGALPDAARAEICELFPELADLTYVAPAARPLLSGRKGRSLAQRHAQNAKPLLADMSV